MRVAILGPLRVSGENDEPIEVGGARLRVLITRLALDPGRVVPAERLVEDLWGDGCPADPAGALQTLVARLRRSLGAARTAIASHPAGYLLDVAREDVDLWAFERAAADGHAALEAGDPERAAVLLRAGLALWRGAPLTDATAAGAGFAAAPAARLEEVRLAMVEDRIDADLAAGTPVAVAEVEQLTREHPLSERLHARLVRVLCAADRRAEALDAYERIRHALADRLGVDPGPELRAAHLAALRTETSPRRGDLPARSTSFVGRTTELAGVRAALEESRLVTLTGFGGAGKTRLAVEAASAWPDPVRLVELGSVADPSGVVPAVLAAVGDGDIGVFGPGAGRTPLDRLGAVLAGRRLLLVLDNCEHVIEAAAHLAEHLLATAPGVALLATSREPLAIAGETLFPLPPLALPAEGADPRTAPAVALFADRAAAVRPGFTVGDDVVRVCRELDGIPLAIELAAARLRSLTPGQLAERIGDRFGLLDHGSRTALPRHRTLRAVVDWSWELLNEDERSVLRRLSVFYGGATAEAVARVCAHGDPVDLLAGLVDKSLLILADDAAGVRYRLLDTVREYAAERLEQAGEAEAVRAAHTAYFLEFAEAADPRLRGREQLEWLARLDADHGNLDAALGHAVATGQDVTALRMMAARLWAWVMRGRRREAAEWATAVLGVAGDEPPPGYELAHALCVLIAPGDGGTLPYEPPPRLRHALEVIQRADRPAAMGAWAMAGGYVGAPHEIRDRVSGVVERFASHPDPWMRAAADMAYGLVQFEFAPGGARIAEKHLRAGLAAFGELGDRWGQALSLFTLGLVLANRGSWAETADVLTRARAHAKEIGGADEIPAPMLLLVYLGQARARAGDLRGARADLDDALAAAERTGDRLALARVRTGLAELARLGGDPGEAAAQQDAALACAPQAGTPPQFRALMHTGAARTAAALGDHDQARELHARALTVIADTGDDVARASVLEGAAEWCLTDGDAAGATAILAAARTLRGIDDTNDPDVLALLGRCSAALGEEGFRAAWERGRALSRPETPALQAMADR